MRERVLRAAFRVFALHGFAGATMRDIASEAAVSDQLMRYHFQSKDELWRSAFEASVSDWVARAYEIAESTASATTRLRQLIALEVQLFAETPELHRIITIETYPGSPRLEWMNERFMRRTFDTLRRVIADAQAEGAARQIAPERLRYAIFAAAAMHSMSSGYQELTGRDPSSPEEVRATIDFINRIVFFEG